MRLTFTDISLIDVHGTQNGTVARDGKVRCVLTEQLDGVYSADPEHLAAADKMLKDGKDAVLKTILIYEEHTIFDIADRLTLEQLKTLAKWLTK